MARWAHRARGGGARAAGPRPLQQLDRAAAGGNPEDRLKSRRGWSTAPRVNDKRTDPETGQRKRFSSAILPPWRARPRRSASAAAAVPARLSSRDFVPALGQFLGSSAGLSSSTVTKLTETWTAEAAAFMTRDLSGADYVYLWVDGIHLGIRLGEGKLCLLVMIGVRADAQAAGCPRRRYRESASRGPTCCATAPCAACASRCWRSATARWGSGARSARCSRRPGPSAATRVPEAQCLQPCRRDPVRYPARPDGQFRAWSTSDRHVGAGTEMGITDRRDWPS